MSGTYQNDVPPPYQPIDPSAARSGGRWGTQPHRSSLNSNVAGSHAQQNQTERTPLTAGGRRYHHNRRTPPQELHPSMTININPPPLPVQPVSIPNQTWLRTHQPSKRRTIPIFSLFMAACFLAIGFLAGFHRGQYTNILDPAVRERIRSDWALEEAGEAQRRRQVADEQARERARWESEKREHERDAAAEKMRRMRARLYWTDLMPKEDECLASGLRGYSARLANVPDGIDVLAACKELPLVFQGVKYDSPEHCESVRHRGALAPSVNPLHRVGEAYMDTGRSRTTIAQHIGSRIIAR
ncbi:hypothetical protein H0H81_011242 [Sphagnurus paluster]|uniref:Uncharacterized protein n=1 Tax=Sphagnurus paluster TaxID=117069 RepID=A0A9P7KFU7_9AGAR|nr:hypothetical protein H0H81_011242 [Sphagnurus paluster]